jgi:PAS domain S-box-containing protein
MSHVVIFDLIAILAYSLTFVIVIKSWNKIFLKDLNIIFLMVIFISLLYSFFLFLEWSGLSDAFDPVEDVIGALLPMVWVFFFYAFLQAVLTFNLRQSERLLIESERKLLTLMTNLPGMAYRCKNDKNWSMEFVSEGCWSLTGYYPNDLLLHGTVSYGDLIHNDDKNTVWEVVQKSVEKKLPFQLIYRIKTASGEEKWVWEQGVGIFSQAGELLVLEGFITNITEQKLAQEAIKRAHGELEEKVKERTLEITEAYQKLEKAFQTIKRDQEKIIQLERQSIASRITSTLAHETRNPISAIGGFARILKRKYADDPDLAPHFDIILEETKKLEHLIAGILKAGNKAAAHLQNLDPDKLLDDLCKLTEEKARLAGIKVRKEKQLSPTRIFADKESIIVALKEIVLNAVEASPRGEEVVLKIDQEEEWVVISVSDSGEGIDDQVLGRIYDPLFSTKRLSAGLGLSFAKELIEAQNGYIRLQTKLGEGSTFHVYFPLSE